MNINRYLFYCYLILYVYVYCILLVSKQKDKAIEKNVISWCSARLRYKDHPVA